MIDQAENLHLHFEVDDGLEELVICLQEKQALLKPEVSKTIPIIQTAVELPDIRLPQLYIPKFNGDFKEWKSFQDLFKSAVNSNKNISGARKLQFLKSVLGSETLRHIQYLSISDENFEKAWSILESRYDNKRELMNSHYRILFNQASMEKENPYELRKLLDTTIECVHALGNLGV